MADQTEGGTITRTAQAKWKGDLRSEVRVRDCPPFFIDEPKARGGLFEHPTPAEYVLSGVSGCSVAHVDMFAKEVGMPLEACRVDGRLVMSRTGGIEEIALDIEVTTSGSREQFERVRGMFRERCILYLFAKKATAVTDTWTLTPPA